MKEIRKIKTRDAVIMYGAATVFSLLVSIPLVFAEQGFVKIVIAYLIPQVAYALSIFLYINVGKLNFNEVIPLRKKISPILLALTVPIAISLIAQDYLIMVGFVTIMEKLGVTMSVSLPAMDTWLSILITLFVICVLPPIFEEIMFRGVFLSALKGRGMRYAIVVSAIIFALSHFNAAQLVHQFIVGVVLGYMGYKAGNIIYGIIVHMLNNGLALLLPHWQFFNELNLSNASSILIMCGMCVAGAGVLWLSLWLFRKECAIKEDIAAFEEKTEKENLLCYNNKTREEEGVHNAEEKIIEKAVQSIRDNPPKLVDLWVLGLCLVLAFILVFTAILG